MRAYSLLLVLVFLLSYVSPFTALSQTPNQYSAQIAEFEAFAKRQMAADSVPGLSVGFIKDGVIWTSGFGYADLENQFPAKAESMFRMASVTKPMTAVAILQLAEKGKLNLDAEVQTYVPYFPKKKFPVTVRQLLGHLGGISHYKDYEAEGRIKVRKNTREAIAIFENFDLVNEPGTRYSYSSYGYNLLGAVIEGASGQSYAEYMTQSVWKPLGMNSTVMDDPYAMIPNRIRGYENVNGKIRNSEFVDISSRFAAGGIRSNVHDMLRFGDGFNSGKILSPASLDLMYNSMATKSGELTYYSAGWSTSPSNGRFVLSHSGGQQETSTYLYTFPSRKLTIAVASNLEGANTLPYVMKLFELLTGEVPSTNAYIAGDRARVPLIVAMQAAFEEGLGYFEKTGKALTEEKNELSQAFALFNQTLNADTLVSAKQQENFAKIGQSRNRASGPLLKIGSFMAAELRKKYGDERLHTYASTGAIGFFHDYIALDQPSELRFNEAIKSHTAAWNRDWTRTHTAAVRSASFSAQSDIESVGSMLRKEFAGADAYPNLSVPMISALENFTRQGQIDKAMNIANLSVDLYPGLDRTHAYQGILLTISNEKEKGKAAIKRSIDLNGNGMASATSLNNFAYTMERIGRRDSGIELLQLAIELYPQEANLYDSLGEFYLKKQMKDKAAEYYQKAIATNPNYPNSAKAKEIIAQIATAK